MNLFPGLGGVETITSSLIEFLGTDNRIYVLSCSQMENVAIPSQVERLYALPHGGLKKKIKCYNKIVDDNDIQIVINQGLYPHINEIIFNRQRNKDVRLISVLHGVPGYEKTEIELILKAKDTKLKWKIYKRLGIDGLVKADRRRRYLAGYQTTYDLAAREGDKIVLLTEEYIEKMVQEYGLHAYREKFAFIQNSLPVSWSALSPVKFEDKRNEVLFVGRLSAEKRVDKILDVWSRLKNNSEWKLTLVGEGNCSGNLEMQVKDLNLKDVCFEGYSSDVTEYYRRAKILLLTSDFEGFPMVLIEAQRFSVVPITFAMSAGPENIVSGGGGVLVRNNDIAGMTSVLDDLMSDENKLKILSERAFEKSSRWTIETVGPMWSRMISSCLSGK